MKLPLITFKLIFLSIFFLPSAQAQNSVDTKIEDLYKVNIINPGISIEKQIIQYNTIQANIYWNTSIDVNKYADKKQYAIFLDPTLNIQYRYYHNYYRRADQGKNVDNNGANFIGGIVERTVTRTPFSSSQLVDKARPVYRLGAIYGMQRTFFKHIILEGYIGAGYHVETKNIKTSNDSNVKYSSGALGVFAQLNIGIPVL